MKLKEIANVQCGLVVARKKALTESQIVKTYPQLNLTAISKDGYIVNESLDKLNAKEIISDDYLTHEGDIVVRLTFPYTSVYIKKRDEGIVVTSNFCLVRNIKNYDGEFLGYYLNCEKVKKQFSCSTQGSTIMNISNTAVEDITILEMDIELQKKYSNLIKLQIKKIETANQLCECESKLLKQVFKNFDKGVER